MKIVPVLLNPTIDQIYEIKNFYVGGTFKVEKIKIYPVGKAISFSLGIREISADLDNLKVLACIGKHDINLYTKFLLERKIDFHFVEIEGKTRSNKTINDPIKNTTTHIREKGFNLVKEDIKILKDLIHKNSEEGDIIVFSGSIPQNVSDNIYADLINLCNKRKIITVLDSSGAALTKGIKANPTIIKPNLMELSQILDLPELNNLDFSDLLNGCKKLVQEAKVLINDKLKIILITLGDKGALCVSESEIFYGYVKVENPIDTVGSGDAFLAGFILNYSLGAELVKCFKNAIACGAANTLIPGPGIFQKGDMLKFLKNIKIIELY